MKIIVYGNSDTHPIYGFPTEEDFVRYIQKDILEKYNHRYQYSQTKTADIIVLARMGKAYGYFVIAGTEKPIQEDFRVADKCKLVYLVKKSVSFEKPVSLKSLEITGYQFGKTLTEQQLEQIKSIAGKKTM